MPVCLTCPISLVSILFLGRTGNEWFSAFDVIVGEFMSALRGPIEEAPDDKPGAIALTR